MSGISDFPNSTPSNSTNNNEHIRGSSSGGVGGRFVTRLQKQELEIVRLREQCRQLTVRAQGLEQWKEGIEKWIREEFDPNFSVRSDTQNGDTFSGEPNEFSNGHQDSDRSEGEDVNMDEEEIVVPSIVQVIGSTSTPSKSNPREDSGDTTVLVDPARNNVEEDKQKQQQKRKSNSTSTPSKSTPREDSGDTTVLVDPARNNVEEDKQKQQQKRKSSPRASTSTSRNDEIGDDMRICALSPPSKRIKRSSDVAVTSTFNEVGAAKVVNMDKASSLGNVADEGSSARKSKSPAKVAEVEDESDDEIQILLDTSSSDPLALDVDNSSSKIKNIKTEEGTKAAKETNKDPLALEVTRHKGSSKTKPQEPAASSQESMSIDPDAPCAVCGNPDVEENNTVIFCDTCNMAVHQACYGVQIVPSGKWNCNPCAEGLDPSKIKCRLCPKVGGALKPVFSPSMRTGHGTWAHVWCVWWVPEVKMGKRKLQEPVQGIKDISQDRKNLKCVICQTKGGAPIQCAVDRGKRTKKCTVAFHATCARDEGLRMDTIDPGGDGELRFKAYCKKHANFGKEADGK